MIGFSSWKGMENIFEGFNRWTWIALGLSAPTLAAAAIGMIPHPGGLDILVNSKFFGILVVTNLGIEADVIKVTDYADIMDYNVLARPGLVVNEKRVASGRIPSEAEATTFITSALETA